MICFSLTSEDAEELAPSFNLTPRPGDPIERPVRTYKQSVVQHLLEKGHTDKNTNECVNDFLRPIQDLINRMSDHTFRVATAGKLTKDAEIYRDGYAYYTFKTHLKDGLSQIDRILVSAMTGATPVCSGGYKAM